jgi:hypothetical protein
MSTPATSKNVYGGIFQYLVQINGDPQQVRAAQAKLAQLTPTTAAVYATLNILPEGQLKGWLMANPVQFWKKVYELIFGRKYTSGDYVLGERLNDQVYCNSGIDRSQVSDQMVDLAHVIFNQLFGVRIATSEDLDALDAGFAAYKARPVAKGITDNAIERAVFLKQHYYPISTYNNQCWDLRYFEMYPLVGRIPDHEIGKWYTGSVLGGANAVDGVIPVSATDVLDQYLDADFDPVTGTVTTADGTVITPGSTPGADGGSLLDKFISFVKTADPILLVGAAAVVAYAYSEFEEND